MKLNEAQQEAVDTTEGALLIIAGAGSGKTSVLTHRIGNLIEKGVNPYNILAVTFTNKAAAEMKERISLRVGENNAKPIWSQTFHSMCSKILRFNGDKLKFLHPNLNSKFSIYSVNDTKSLMKKVLDTYDSNETIKVDKFGKETKKKSYFISGLALDSKENSPQSFLEFISKMKNEMIDVETLKSYKPSNSYIDWKKAKEVIESSVPPTLLKCYIDVYEKYQLALRNSNALDFDDLIFYTIKLFINDPDTLQFYQNKFEYIMVDEYQDTNHCQYVLVKMLADKHGNIAVVGDDSQSIYKFRGADIRNILEFEKDYKNCKVVMLEENYRCTPTILKAANEIIAHNVNQRKKNLFTSKKDGEKIGYFTGYNDKTEATFVVNEIKRLQRKKVKLSDVAILYRNNSLSRVMEDAIIRAGMPYQVIGGFKFFDRAEVLDILAYLKFVENPNDTISFSRIINTPKRGIGKKTVDTLISYNGPDFFGFLKDPSAHGVKITKKAQEALSQFVTVIEKTKEDVDNQILVSSIIKNLLNELSYFEFLKSMKDGKGEDRVANVKELVNTAFEKEEIAEEYFSLTDFLEHAALYSAQDDTNTEDIDKIQLMTLHSSKGLEFPYVFIIGMEEGIFPSVRSGVVEDIEEERRLAYVGITRAKDRLYFTNSQSRLVFGVPMNQRASQFVTEFDQNLVEKIYNYY